MEGKQSEDTGFLIVEDHFMFREVISAIVKDRIGARIVEATEKGAVALECFEANLESVDIVLLDLDLPDMDGMELAEKMIQLEPRKRLLAVSSQCDEYTLFRVLRSGLFGFIDKTKQSLDELEHGIREVMEWRPFYSASVHQTNLSQLADPRSFPKILTPREQELLRYFGVGMRNEEVASIMGLSTQTAQGHRRNIMQKLGVSSTPELIRYALKMGFSRVSWM